MLQQFIILFPELLLTLFALSAQLLVVFYRIHTRTIINSVVVAIFILLFTLVLLGLLGVDLNSNGFGQSFVINQSVIYSKILILAFTIATIIIYNDYCKISEIEAKIEFITLILFSTIGIFLSISTRNLLLLFCGLELQALTAYSLAGFNGDIKSSESAVKYFVLGALISCISLLGMSFLYGFSGSLDFEIIFDLFATQTPNLGLVVGAVLVLAGILFKFSAAPMHMWTLDVYEGAPISAVSYFATAQKIGVLVILLNIISFMIGDYAPVSVFLIKIAAIISMIIGALGAIMQKSLKRLMAYSTILNVGYVLIGVSLHTESGRFAAMLYMFIYSMGVLAFFTCLIALFGKKVEQVTFDDLSGIASSRKTMAGIISVIMFSMIGLPPLAGFFGKYHIFYGAIHEGEFTLAVIGVITSVIAGFYYLKIIKSMYFVKTGNKLDKIVASKGLLTLASITTCFILFFSLFAAGYLKYLF